MATRSMYRLIMDLPLFKGVGKDHVSAFLEKTPVSFDTYQPGDLICRAGSPCDCIRFVISGQASAIQTVGLPEVSVTERCAQGRVFGADRLFGVDTAMPGDVVADTTCSVMSFSKAQYMALLSSNPLYQLNFFNYLSARAQRGPSAESTWCSRTPLDSLRRLVALLTDPSALSVSVEGSDKALAAIFGVAVSQTARMRQYLSESGLAQCNGTLIEIPSRTRLLDS